MSRLPLLTAAFAALATTCVLAADRYAWVGTYHPNGEGIYRFHIDAHSGALTQRTRVNSLPNAAQLTASRDGKTLYVAAESTPGLVQALRVGHDGQLTLLNQVASGGNGPVYLSLTPAGHHLLVANYVSGSVAVLPVHEDGRLGEASDIQRHQGPAGAARPAAAAPGSFAISDHNGPHAHMIAADPSGQYVFATDLGLDRIYQYRFDAGTGKLAANNPPWIAASSVGAGPRHFVFTPQGDGLWLINEEASTLTYYSLDSATGTLRAGASYSSLPASFKGTSFAAGLVLSHDGRHLYVANRLHNSISHFTVTEAGKLTLRQNIWSHGDYPRSLTLDARGNYLYALNQRSDVITRFSIAPQDGQLTLIDDATPVGSPSQMVITQAP